MMVVRTVDKSVDQMGKLSAAKMVPKMVEALVAWKDNRMVERLVLKLADWWVECWAGALVSGWV